MYSLAHNKISYRKKAIRLPPSIGESYVGLRSHLGDGIFLLEDGDLGVTYQIDGICDEALTEDELYSAFLPLVKFIRPLVRGIPSYHDDGSTVIQLICSQRIHQSTRSSELASNEAGILIADEETHLFKAGLIERTFYLSVRWAPRLKKSFLKEAKQGLELLLQKGKADSYALTGLVQAKNLFHKELLLKESESGLTLRRLAPRQVISYYNSVFAGGVETSFDLDADDLNPLWQDMISSNCGAKGDGFFSSNGNIKVFSYAELPSTFALGRLRQFIDYLPMKTWDLVWILSHGSKKTTAEHTIKKLFFAQGPAQQKKYEDLLSFEEGIEAANPMAKMSLRLVGYNLTDEIESKIISASSDIVNCPIVAEQDIAPHLIASALPMNCSRDGHNIIGRQRSVLLDRAICFAPCYRSASNPKAERSWLARNGEPSRIDIFGSGGNNHMCILGNSESGKSCLMTQFIVEFIWRFASGVVRVIDRKTSYRKLCDLFGGQIIAFNEAFLRENPYSPFSYEKWDEDDVNNTVVFLHNAILQLNPDAIVSGLHTEILAEAIKTCANDHERNKVFEAETGELSNPHPTWIDIKKKLPVACEAKGSSSLVLSALDDICRWTVSFDRTGQYGFLFCAIEKQASCDTRRIVIYDLDGISDPRLQLIASQLAFLKVSRDLKKLARKDRKLIVFEELGILVQGDNPNAGDIASRFIRNVVKTARKIGAQAIGITNELDDFTKSEAGKAFWKIAPQKLFLPLSDSAKQQVSEELHKELSAADIDVIRDLIIKKGFFSQGYLLSANPTFKGSFLIPLSPKMNALVTTTAKEEDYYDQLIKDGFSPLTALDKMASNHPYGAGL